MSNCLVNVWLNQLSTDRWEASGGNVLTLGRSPSPFRIISRIAPLTGIFRGSATGSGSVVVATASDMMARERVGF